MGVSVAYMLQASRLGCVLYHYHMFLSFWQGHKSWNETTFKLLQNIATKMQLFAFVTKEIIIVVSGSR